MLQALRQRFNEWVALLPPEPVLRELSNAKAWLTATAMAATAIALAAWIPFSAHLFELRPWPAIAAYLAAIAVDFFCLDQLRRLNTALAAQAMLAQTSLLQLFCVLLVINSTLFGAVLFASWLLVVAGVHGHFYRADTRHPFVSAATLLVTAVGIGMAPSKEHVAVLAVIGPASAITAAFLGSFAVESEHARAEAEQLRSTIQAQLVWEHSVRADRLAGSLEQVAQWNHDMRNAMTAAVCNAQMLALGGEDDQGEDEVREAIHDIQQSLEVLSEGFEELRRISRHSSSEGKKQAVDLVPLARTVVFGVRTRFPSIDVTLEAPLTPLLALVRGGAVSVHRILENLLVNACEGDGKTAAHRVRAMVRGSPSVRIEVRDDGPGFPQYLLDGPAPIFVSSKPRGSGLGLHGVEQLVAASDGRLVRSNAPEGGAVVVVELLAAPPATEGINPTPST